MKMTRKLFALAVIACAFCAPAFAQEEVMPLDPNGTDEQIHEQGSSGFDTPGPIAIPEGDYEAGDNGDGTWTPEVPEVLDPEPMDGSGDDSGDSDDSDDSGSDSDE